LRGKRKIGLAEQRDVPPPPRHVIAPKNRGKAFFGHFVAG